MYTSLYVRYTMYKLFRVPWSPPSQCCAKTIVLAWLPEYYAVSIKIGIHFACCDHLFVHLPTPQAKTLDLPLVVMYIRMYM